MTAQLKQQHLGDAVGKPLYVEGEGWTMTTGILTNHDEVGIYLRFELPQTYGNAFVPWANIQHIAWGDEDPEFVQAF